jgi:hypothetical protein
MLKEYHSAVMLEGGSKLERPKKLFGRVFNIKLGCFCNEYKIAAYSRAPQSRVENSAPRHSA